MGNYDLQNIVPLPCPEHPCTQETELTLPLVGHSALHACGGQPKQAFSSCVTPLDISHLPRTVR